jgi:hypothetical protein
MLQEPPISWKRSAPNKEGLSNLGQHSQSIEPPRETSATERPSPIREYS